MKIAVYPGSFDPLTIGHLDIALRAKKLFDKVYIMIAENTAKTNHYFFSLEERIQLAKEVFEKYPGFEVVVTKGVVVSEAKKLGACALIRGIRALTDYEAEYQLHEVNNFIEPDIDMVYLMAKQNHTFISSSNIKELYRHGVDFSSLVPKEVYQAMIEKKNS